MTNLSVEYHQIISVLQVELMLRKHSGYAGEDLLLELELEKRESDNQELEKNRSWYRVAPK